MVYPDMQSLIEGNEVALDILLICANKPVNYANLNSFALDDLWNAAKTFAAVRGHGNQAISGEIQAVQEAIMYERLPEPIGLGGIDVKEQSSGAQLYYARERHFQDLLYDICKDKIQQSIYDTLGFPIDKARQRECQIAQVYLQYLNDILFHNQSINGIAIDIDKFKHYYDQVFGKEMPPAITRQLIMEVLQQARLGYEYDGKFYPFWYTTRGDVGYKFRQMLAENIAARIA